VKISSCSLELTKLLRLAPISSRQVYDGAVQVLFNQCQAYSKLIQTGYAGCSCCAHARATPKTRLVCKRSSSNRCQATPELHFSQSNSAQAISRKKNLNFVLTLRGLAPVYRLANSHTGKQKVDLDMEKHNSSRFNSRPTFIDTHTASPWPTVILQ
jgi:hypothetical protein